MKKFTIKNKILILLSFVFLFISSFAISTFAYHEDSNGNLVSDNVFNYKNIISSKFTDLGNNSFKLNWGGVSTILTLPYSSFESNTQYSFTLTSLNGAKYWAYNLSWNYSDNTSERFTNNQGVDYGTYSYTSAVNKTVVSITWIINFEADFKDLMINIGEPKEFEPYESIYYGTNTLNRLSRNIYGPYAYVTNIDLLYNNGSSSSLYKSYSNIYDLSLESFVKFRNQCIEIDDYKFIFTTLGGNSTWKFTLNFTFANSSLRVSDFNEWYFYGPIPYNFTFSNSSSLSGTSSDNPLIVNLTNSGITSTTFISSFSFTRNNPNIALAITKVGTPNSTLGYDNGYITGHDDAINEINEYYKPIIQQYKDNINTLAERISYLENGTRNYTNLIWTIGATPWESFKNIWNVEFGGINIANIVTGLVTALLVIYLIKKIWK